MLEQLVESKRKQANRAGFLFTTFVLVAGLCFSAVLWSLFAMNLSLGNEEFDLSALVAPVMPVETKPEPVQEKEQIQTQENVTETTRQANILRTDESPTKVPDTISVTQNTQKARPIEPFVIKDGIERNLSGSQDSFSGNSNSIAQSVDPNIRGSNNENDGPELVKKPVVKKEPTVLRTSQIINSKATYLPKPIYPAVALTVRAGGAVNVQVMIDESGKVISAKAVTGHSLLRGSAESAARNARFTPTILNQQAVRVTGLIVYNFVRN